MSRIMIESNMVSLPARPDGKDGKDGYFENISFTRARIASPHDTHAMPDMQVSCRGLRGEQLIFEFEL